MHHSSRGETDTCFSSGRMTTHRRALGPPQGMGDERGQSHCRREISTRS